MTDREMSMRYQSEMVNICRELGIEPNTMIPDPEYYADMIIEEIDNLKAIIREGEN